MFKQVAMLGFLLVFGTRAMAGHDEGVREHFGFVDRGHERVVVSTNTPPRPSAVLQAPEINPDLGLTAVLLLAGTLAVIRARRVP